MQFVPCYTQFVRRFVVGNLRLDNVHHQGTVTHFSVTVEQKF